MANMESGKLRDYVYRLLPVMLMTVFGLQMIRLLLSSLVVYMREIVGINSLVLGPIGLGIFSLSLLALLLHKLAGSRNALRIVMAGLCIIRIAEQASPWPALDIWLAAAGAVCFILFIPIILGISWNRGDKTFLGTALFLGIILDCTILIITSTVDLSWFPGFWPILTVILFSLVLLSGQYKSLSGSQPEDTTHGNTTHGNEAQGEWRSSLAAAGIGPFIALQLLIFQNIPRLSASMQINTPTASFVIVMVNGIALSSALFYNQLKFNRLIKFLIPGILLILLLCIPKPLGLVYLAYLAVGQIASLLLFIPLFASPDRVFPGAIHRLGAANFIGQLLLVILIFVYYIPYDIDLGFRSWVVLPVIALLLLLCSLLKSREQTEESGSLVMILKPALFAFLPVIIPIFLLAAAGDAKPASPLPGNRTVRILTYNLYNSYNVNGFFAAEEHAREIEKSKADIVALQEVIRGMLDWNGADMIELLSRRLNMPYTYGFTTDVMAGNAILSRYPIIKAENFILQPDFIPTLRGCLKVTIDIGGTELTVMATHLYHLKSHPEYRTMQTTHILALWNKQPKTVIMGDFNTEPGTEPINLMEAASLVNVPAKLAGAPLFTWPATKPAHQFDYIWVSPDLKVSDFVLHKDIVSDHCAMSAQITIP